MACVFSNWLCRTGNYIITSYLDKIVTCRISFSGSLACVLMLLVMEAGRRASLLNERKERDVQYVWV